MAGIFLSGMKMFLFKFFRKFKKNDPVADAVTRNSKGLPKPIETRGFTGGGLVTGTAPEMPSPPPIVTSSSTSFPITRDVVKILKDKRLKEVEEEKSRKQFTQPWANWQDQLLKNEAALLKLREQLKDLNKE